MLALEPTKIKRKKGQNEYLIWSLKADGVLTLYEKSHVLYVLRQEFNPYVTTLSGQAFQVQTQYGTAIFPISAQHGDQPILAVFDTPQVVIQKIATLCEQSGWILEIVTTSPHVDSSHEFWNLLEMHQWLLRWRSRIREKEIQAFVRIIRPGQELVLGDPSEVDATAQITLIYELVRRGRLVLKDISSKRICPESIFSAQGNAT